MESYSPSKFEKKWQKIWQEKGLYRAADSPSSAFRQPSSESVVSSRISDFTEGGDQKGEGGKDGGEGKTDGGTKPKFYVLVEFPYPSGERLHVGHGRSYNCLDALARYKRMKGGNVLFPIGWDAFGLPAENYAIKSGIHPSLTTKENIAKAKAQALSWGLSFDWTREINTTDPKYYRWTQWIFLQLLKKDLAYRAEIAINWCPACKINLANEEVIDGNCERCGAKTERRRQKQWMLAITKYADRLLNDLDSVDYEPRITRQQIEWIGKKEGIKIKFKIQNSKFKIKEIEVFTTRPETMFGATFIVLAPEHPLVAERLSRTVIASDRPAGEAGAWQSQTGSPRGVIPRDDEGRTEKVRKYVEAAKSKSELERIAEGRKKTGVFTGLYAVNPLNGRQIPIWISDFVLSTVGTGAIMGVPGHDKRDFEFAKEFGLEVKRVVVSNLGDSSNLDETYEGEGFCLNSGFLDGLPTPEAKEKIMDFLEEKRWGQRTVSYHLRDWVFSRQHYWGEPIPIIYCCKCLENSKLKTQKSKFMTTIEGGIEFAIVPVPEDQLPVELPYVENYQPTQSGESPLAALKEWVIVSCPECHGPARRETDTMPNWAGSSWYYIAYLIADKLRDSENSEGQKVRESDSQKVRHSGSTDNLITRGTESSENTDIFTTNKDLINHWLPVDWYNGGMEHTTLHLLYSRFWHKFLYDLGLVPTVEPYAKRTSHGVVLGPDGAKMSKSKGNVINPDEIVARFGADSFRLYEMFMGPFAQEVAWNMNGVAGVYRFLGRVWNLFEKRRLLVKESSSETERIKIPDPERARRAGSGILADPGSEVQRRLAKLSRKVASDIENLKFNTAVAALMEFTNHLSIACPSEPWRSGVTCHLSLDQWSIFLRLLAPFAPHMAEELWQRLHNGQWTMGNGQRENNSQFSILNSQFRSIHQQPWPELEVGGEDREVEIVVQIDGKLRDRLKLSIVNCQLSDKVETEALKSQKVQKYLDSREYKVVFVPGKLINFVTSSGRSRLPAGEAGI